MANSGLAWVDTHCHIYMGSDPPEVVVDRAVAAGVTKMVVVGVDLPTSQRSVDLSRSDERLVASAGIHPNEVGNATEEDYAKLRDLVKAGPVVAVGETGMDFYRGRSDPSVQEEWFRRHIRLAKSSKRCLIVHTRSAHDATKQILEDEGPPERMVMHCFSGSAGDGYDYLELGAYLSVAGPVTFKNAPDLRRAARQLPLERMLVETDSPFLSPHPYRGKENEPGKVPLVGAAIAELKGLPVEEVAEVTTANAESVFGLG